MDLIGRMLKNYTTLAMGASSILLGLHLLLDGKPTEGLTAVVSGVGLIREALRPD